MAKTLLYRLFGAWKIREELASVLKREGILLQNEGIRGSVTYRNFRAPGKYAKWKRQWFTASIALTEARLVALRHARPIIDVPLADVRIRSLLVSLVGGDTLLVVHNAALFHEDWSGTIEHRFRTPQAKRFLDLLQSRLSDN